MINCSSLLISLILARELAIADSPNTTETWKNYIFTATVLMVYLVWNILLLSYFNKKNPCKNFVYDQQQKIQCTLVKLANMTCLVKSLKKFHHNKLGLKLIQ